MGDTFLPDVKLTDLQAMLKKEPAGKPCDMLLAAIKRKEGCSEEYIGECLGRAQRCKLRSNSCVGTCGSDPASVLFP